jgi:hypothetical protein
MGKMLLALLPLPLLIREVAVVFVEEEVDGGRSEGGAAMMGFRYFCFKLAVSELLLLTAEEMGLYGDKVMNEERIGKRVPGTSIKRNI